MSEYIRIREVFINGHIICLEDEIYRILQNQMFSEIWRVRKHECVISREPLIEGRTYMFHHILEKRAFEKYALCKWNIMLLDYKVHNQYEVKSDTVPQIVSYRSYLLSLLDDPECKFDNDHIWRDSDDVPDLTSAFMGGKIQQY